MLNLRGYIESVVKNLKANKKEDQIFSFGAYTWKTLIIKKFIQSFNADEEVSVTIEQMNGYDAMVFKWRNGHAFVYPIEFADKLRREQAKKEKVEA